MFTAAVNIEKIGCQMCIRDRGMACVGGCVGGPSKHKTELEAKKERDLLTGQADDREVHANLKNLGVEQVAMHRH